MLKVLDLFSGIGGFSLGLERTGGFETVAFCEVNPFARAVLATHWPETPIYEDVRTLTAERLRANGIAVDVITGGFPCQDISYAGKGAGLDGERSGLFFEISRLVGELGPRLVVLENVSALLGRGLAEVLGTLASLGYDAEWHCIPASHVGAPHQRDRIWLVAYPRGEQHQGAGDALWGQAAAGLLEAALADADRQRLEGVGADPDPVGRQVQGMGSAGLRDRASHQPGLWTAEPAVGRVADGVPYRVDRLHALGNAVVPQVVELIGRAILAAEASRLDA